MLDFIAQIVIVALALLFVVRSWKSYNRNKVELPPPDAPTMRSSTAKAMRLVRTDFLPIAIGYLRRGEVPPAPSGIDRNAYQDRVIQLRTAAVALAVAILVALFLWYTPSAAERCRKAGGEWITYVDPLPDYCELR